MDPQSLSFTPHTQSSENWRMQNDFTRIQQVQAEHADRISRLERKHEDDARMKSVWGTQSPFPSVLSGTPQQAPLQQPPSDHFRNFDDEANNLMSSLHLDAEDEPRRALGANSRANSVRFDESANQNHFSHSSRPSMDFLSRTSSGLGGLQMTERSSSHKSEGRASSVHSIRSLASGRANSLSLESSAYGLSDLNRPPHDAPAIAPGLLLLGPAPAIIRCWMNTNFKNDALLYAAVCTGSYKSFVDLRLIQKLGFESNIKVRGDNGIRVVNLPIYFPEAVPHPPSSRPSSPAPSLPSISVEFRVVERTSQSDDSKAIQIFLGSDFLRAHNADILFSTSSMTIFDIDRTKLSIPLARPENETAFDGLYVASGASQTSALIQSTPISANEPAIEPLYLNGLGQASSTASISSTTSPPPGKYQPPGALAAAASSIGSNKPGTVDPTSEPPSSGRSFSLLRPSLSMLNTKAEREETQPQTGNGSQTAPLRSASNSASWGSWRREGPPSTSPQPSNLDWANMSRNRDTSYQRKDTGIRVLKPKTANRTLSTTVAATPTSTAGTSSPSDGKSRFFDEGRRRSSMGENNNPLLNKTSTTSNTNMKENATTTTTTTSTSTAAAAPKTKANPIGGASAFSWLNSGGGPSK